MAKKTSKHGNHGQKAAQTQRSKFTDHDADVRSGKADVRTGKFDDEKQQSLLKQAIRIGKKHKRPRIDVPYTQVDVSLEILSILGLVALLTIAVLSWSKLPDQIPKHFGASGMPDAWTDKSSIWLLPGFGVVLYLVLTLISKFPHTFNYPWPITEANAEKQYRYGRALMNALKADTIGLFAYIEFMTIQIALGKAEGLGILFLPIFLGVMFGTIGIWFIMAYRAR